MDLDAQALDTPTSEATQDELAMVVEEVARLRRQLFDAGDESVVEAPRELSALFRDAERRVEAFFRGFRADPRRAEIEVSGQRYVMVRGAALSVEFFQMVRRLFRAEDAPEADRFSARLLYDLAHATGRNDADDLTGKMQLEDPLARLSAGPVHFAYTGWANVRLHEECCTEPGDDFCLRYDHPRSFEAEAWLEDGVFSEQPVCIMNAGYSSGWCEHAFGVPLDAVEVSCRARGDDACRFVMAPPHRLADQVAAMRRRFPGPPLRPLAGSAPELLARRDIEEADRRGQSGARSPVQAERRLLAYAHALEATRELLRRKIHELEQEIAERRRAQHRMESAWRALDEIPTALLWVDCSLRVTHANRAARALLDATLEELLDHDPTGSDGPLADAGTRDALTRARARGTSVVRLWRRSGDGRRVCLEANPDRRDDGDLLVCFLEDEAEEGLPSSS